MESSKFREVLPVRPAFPYIGGKSKLAARLIERIEAIPHETYAEPFVGAGGVFLRRRLAPKAEVINDYSREVATFFRVLQRHYTAFMDMLRFQITSRAEFERLAQSDPETLTDLERAARLLYLQRAGFGGRVRSPTFGVSPGRAGTINVTRLAVLLEELHHRLAGVVIERLPYTAFLQRYDRRGTLFYLDPPYWASEDDYGKGMFSRADFQGLAEILGELKGQWLLSINDRPEVRQIFKAFKIEAVRTTYSVARSRLEPGAAAELIISPKRR